MRTTEPTTRHRSTRGRTRFVGAAVGMAALAAVLTGCGDEGPTEVTVNEAQDPTQFGITVTGVGQVRGEPDTLVLTIGVSVKAGTVAEALDRASTSSDAVLTALKEGGVADEDLQTRDYSIDQEFRYPDDGGPVPDGFRVTNTVEARLRDLDAAGEVIDAAVRSGGDDVRLQGIAFDLEEDSELLAQARVEAYDDAQAQAGQLAELAGQELGPAEFISEGAQAPTPVPYDTDRFAAEAADGAEAISVEPGTVQGTVRVTVRYPLG